MKKRIVSAVVAVCLMFGTLAALPQNTFTDSTLITASATSLSDFDYKIYDTSVVINKYKGSDATVTVPSSIGGKPVTWLNTGAFAGNTSVKKVELPSSLLGIKDSVFKGCSKLEEVIGLENTQVTTLQSYTFQDCKKLKTISLPKTLTTIAVSVFQNCSSLTSVYGLDKTKVTTISNDAFHDCTNLSYIKFPTTLTSLGMNAFNNCDLETVDLYSTKITRVPDYCFRDNGDLRTVNLPLTVTYIGQAAFLNCDALTTVNLSVNLKTISERAFVGCSSLSSENLLKSCSNLETIGKWAFLDCKNLKRLFLPSSLVTLGEQFYGYTYNRYSDAGGSYYYAYEPYDNGNRTIIIYPTATAAKNYYNAYNAKWPSSKNKMYLETLTCKHSYSSAVTKEATCTATGVRTFTCSICKDSYTTTISAKGHNYGTATTASLPTPVKQGQTQKTCKNCGYVLYTPTDPTNVRVYGSNRYATSTNIADQLKAAKNNEPYKYYVIADGRKFADALSASYLARVCDAPILLVTPGNEKLVTDYIQATCGSSKPTAYVIGGTGAVSEDSYNKIKAVCSTVARLDGKNRYETSRVVLSIAAVLAAVTRKSVGDTVIIADGNEYADALSASTTGQPILLVNGKAKSLTTAEKDSIKLIKNAKVVIAGGESAVSKEIEADAKTVKTTTRVYGKDRYKTSVAIANYFFKTPSAITLAYGGNFPDGLCGGPLGYATNSPLILTAKGREADANTYVKSKNVKTAWILGGPTIVSDDTVKAVFK